jgi:hypothetical protein
VDRVKGSSAVERDLLAASAYLAIGDGALHILLQHGQTLAEVAASTKGRSVQGLSEAIVKARTSRLAIVAKAGLISTSEERKSVAALPATVDKEIHRKPLQAPASK